MVRTVYPRIVRKVPFLKPRNVVTSAMLLVLCAASCLGFQNDKTANTCKQAATRKQEKQVLKKPREEDE